MMDNPKYNPLSEKWKRIYSDQPQEIKEKLDALDKMNWKEYQLRVIKRKKPILNEGDVFVLSPRENVFFYGKVFKTNINHIKQNGFIHGKNVVFLFQNKTTTPTMEDFHPDYDKLLIKPAIVDISYWNKGYFFNVGNEEVSDYERNLDYGFLDLGTFANSFCKEDGVKLTTEPKLLGIYGITTMTGIASKVERELIVNPKLLEFE